MTEVLIPMSFEVCEFLVIGFQTISKFKTHDCSPSWIFNSIAENTPNGLKPKGKNRAVFMTIKKIQATKVRFPIVAMITPLDPILNANRINMVIKNRVFRRELPSEMIGSKLRTQIF
jgi:hypothetical protein